MDKIVPKLQPFYPKEFKLRYKVKQDEEQNTLRYTLNRNNIKFISEKEKEINIPSNCQITYISPKGKLILANNEGKNSTHDEIASIIRPRGDKNSRKSMAELLAKGFIIFADISSSEEKMACICYMENSTTQAQHDRLEKIQEQYNYDYMPDVNTKEDVLEQLKDDKQENNNSLDCRSLA